MKLKHKNIEAVLDSLFPGTKKMLIELFFSYPAEPFTVTDIIAALGGGRSTVQELLSSFLGSGIIKARTEGRKIYYQADGECVFFPELLSMVNKTLAAKLEVALRKLPGVDVAFIYGSVAKGEARKRSDVDLMVIGEVSFSKISGRIFGKLEAIRRQVNPSVYGRDEFSNRVASKEPFISGVMSGPRIFVIGDDNELGKLVEGRMASATSLLQR